MHLYPAWNRGSTISGRKKIVMFIAPPSTNIMATYISQHHWARYTIPRAGIGANNPKCSHRRNAAGKNISLYTGAQVPCIVIKLYFAPKQRLYKRFYRRAKPLPTHLSDGASISVMEATVFFFFSFRSRRTRFSAGVVQAGFFQHFSIGQTCPFGQYWH